MSSALVSRAIRILRACIEVHTRKMGEGIFYFLPFLSLHACTLTYERKIRMARETTFA